MKISSDVAFSPAVKQLQAERGSRGSYANRGFRTEVDDDLRAFLADIDTAFLATANAEGQPYVQHRGGPRGFIRVLDEEHLAFVDFKGNKQFISTGNLTENDRVCLFLMDYSQKRRVKIWGTAKTVAATPDLVEELSDPAYVAKPEQVMIIRVTAWDVNCPAHIPQKVDVQDVVHVVTELRARVAQLEEENARLRKGTAR